MTVPLPPRPREIAVVRALPGLGDFLCAVPALRALHAGFPDARLTLIGLPAVRPLAARYAGLLDGFLDFPGFPGVPELPANVTALPGFLWEVQGRFDLAVQLHGSGTVSNVFTALLGARVTAGLRGPGAPCPDPATFLFEAREGHEVRRWLDLAAFLGCPPVDETPDVPLTPGDGAAARALLPDGAPYALVHPGASEARRRLDPAALALVADGLAHLGLRVVLTGSANEADATAAVRRRAASAPLDLAGRTDLGALGALVRGARLVVTNDTGVSHLAAALRVPSVVAFLASDPARWAPLDAARHRALVRPDGERVLAEARSLLALHGETARA